MEARGKLYEAKYLESVKAFTGVREVFEVLTRDGGRIALATDCKGTRAGAVTWRKKSLGAKNRPQNGASVGRSDRAVSGETGVLSRSSRSGRYTVTRLTLCQMTVRPG
jgi:hypothetical protein